MQRVIKLSPARFLIAWDEDKLPLVIDFNPIISSFNLKGNYQLIHWQARPKGLRKFGVYDAEIDDYLSTTEFSWLDKYFIDLLQIDENVFNNTVPTAVIYLEKLTRDESQ